VELEGKTPLELLALSARIHRQLRRMKVVRSENKPTGDYGEYLVADALGLTLVEKSNKGFDAFDPKSGKRYEIKSRRLMGDKPTGKFGVLRGLPEQRFDHLAVVVFDEEYRVLQGAVLPHAVVEGLGGYSKHVNGWLLPVSAKVWAHPSAADIRAELRRVQRG
jgi:hypothetical protein